MEYALKLILIFASAWITLRQIYWWQVKEYRFDRWWSWMRFNQGFRELWGTSLRRPAMTFRTVIMMLLWLGTGLFLGRWWGWLIAAYIGPILGVMGTSPANWLGKIVLMEVAKKRIEAVKPKIIGITGSYGKTSSKELLAQALEGHFRIVKTLKNENTEISIARRILAVIKPGVEVFVMEVGAYRWGEIARVCRMAPPDIAWVTAIGNQHLDLFGGVDNLKRAKFEIVEGLKPGGVAVFNKAAGEEDLIRWAKEINVKSVVYEAGGREGNKVGVTEVARLMGLSNVKIGVIPGLEIKETPGGIKVIDSSYSTNQQTFEEDIDLLEKMTGRRFVVSPGIIELGRETENVHKKLRERMKDLDGVWMGEYKGIEKTLRSGDIVLIEGRIPSGVKNKILSL